MGTIRKAFKSIVFLAVFITPFTNLSAQHRLLLRIVENITEGDYNRAVTQIQNLRKDYGGSIYEATALYFLFRDVGYPSNNPDSAFFYLKKVENRMPIMTAEDLETICLKLNIHPSKIFRLEVHLAEASWDRVLFSGDWHEANAFFRLYSADIHHTIDRINWRDEAELKYYVQRSDLQALRKFISGGRKTNFVIQANEVIDSLEFLSAGKINTEQCWMDYLKEHPKTKNAKYARDQYELKVFMNCKSFEEPDSINRYLVLFPDGKYAKEALMVQEEFFFRKLSGNRDIKGLLIFRSKYPRSQFHEKVDEMIDEILWKKCLISMSIEDHISYLVESNLLFHKMECEDRLLQLWVAKWEPSAVHHLSAIHNKISNPKLISLCTNAIDSLKLEEIISKKSFTELERFLSLCQDSNVYKRSLEMRPLMMLEDYERTKKYSTGIMFITQYPDSPETALLRENLAEEYISSVNVNKKINVTEFLRYFEGTQAHNRIKGTIEKEIFYACVRSNTVNGYKKYLEQFPNGAYEKRARTGMMEAWNDYFLQNYKRLFVHSDFEFTVDMFMSSSVLKHYYKNCESYLRDLLAEYSVMSSHSEDESYNFLIGQPQNRYNFYQSALQSLKKYNLPYEQKINALYIDGVSFYDRRKSEFCWECARYSDTMGNGSVVIIDIDGKQLTELSYKSVVATMVPHVFFVTNAKNKLSLYNTKERTFITGWHDEINVVVLNPYNFKKNSLEHSLVSMIAIPVGFVTVDSGKDYTGGNERFINFSGQLLIDNSALGVPVLEEYGFNNNSAVILSDAQTFKSITNFGTPQMKPSDDYVLIKKRKKSDLGNYYSDYFGIANITLDTVFLEANYSNICGINDFGVVRVDHQRRSKSCKSYPQQTTDFFDIHSRKLITSHSGGVSCEEVFVPFFSSGRKFDNTWNAAPDYFNDITPSGNFTIDDREQFEGMENDMKLTVLPDSVVERMHDYLYTFPRPVFYISRSNYTDCRGNNRTEYGLLSSRGQTIYNATDEISAHSYLSSFVIFEVENKGCLLVTNDGKLLFDAAKDNYFLQFINEDFLFFWRDKDAVRSGGIYSIKNGEVCEAIYENIKIEEDGVYGYRLGVVTKINVPFVRME